MTIWNLFITVCTRTYASSNTYGGIGLHIYTHQATRTYASAYTYICVLIWFRYILYQDLISLSPSFGKRFLGGIFVARQTLK